MPGPIPTPKSQRRRTNTDAIPTTDLPASGRKGSIPRPPKWFPLGDAATAWWKWAWRTPQAAAWSYGMVPVVARRAALEDDFAALAEVESLDLLDVLDEEVAVKFKAVIGRLAGLVSNRLSVMKEARELDDRLGLTPKGMAALRWTIVPDAEPEEKPQRADVRRLRAVDPHAVAGA